MKRTCKLIAILTTAILLLTSAAASAEMIVIIEDIQMGALYQPAADDHSQDNDEEIDSIAPVMPADMIIIEEDSDEDGVIDTVVAPVVPVAEIDSLFEEDEEEWIAPPQIAPETDENIEDELLIEEMTERETTTAEVRYAFDGDAIHLGDTVTLIADVADGADVQWQQQRPGESWTNIPGANAAQHYVVVTSDNADSNWRCLVTE